MKNQLAIVLLIIVGAVFIYASVKGQDPRDVFKSALRRNNG